MLYHTDCVHVEIAAETRLAETVTASCATQSLTSCAKPFVSFLLKRIHDPNRPAITRTACAAYLASFLARAKFLPKSLLIQSLLDMAKWCADYCKTQNLRQAASPLSASSSAFHMGVQHQVSC